MSILISNSHTINVVISKVKVQASAASTGSNGDIVGPRSELNNNGNMMVLSKKSFIFENMGRTWNVEPFTTELRIAENVHVVDSEVAYDFTYKRESFILLIRNTLYVTSMHHNLLPHFITRAGGVKV